MPDKPVIEVESAPSKTALHVRADWVELLCLKNLDPVLSIEDVVDRVTERSDLGELDQGDTGSDDPISARRHDRIKRQAADWFGSLLHRERVFGDAYPFEVATEHGSAFLRRLDGPSVLQRLYLFLLAASNLGYVSKKYWQTITYCFEELSAAAMVRCLPAGSEVHMFGPRARGRYQGKLWDRITLLAEDLGERVDARQAEFERIPGGDGGLDVVGWFSLGDSNPSKLVIFSQCACTAEWVDKQHQSNYHDRWRRRLTCLAEPVNMCFIPLYFRDSLGKWHREDDIRNSVLVDRPRLMHLLRDQADTVGELLPHDILDLLIQERAPLF